MSKIYHTCPIWHEECLPACMLKLRKDNIPPELSPSSCSVKECWRAGVFAYRDLNLVLRMAANLDENAKVRLCAEIAHQNVVYKNPPMLNGVLIRKIQSQSTPLMPKRLDLALEWLVHHSPRIDSAPLLDKNKIPSFLAFSYCQGKTDNERMNVDVGEAAKIIQALAKEGLVEMIAHHSHFNQNYRLPQVTYKGYAHYEELQRKSVDSSLAFVAMWFNPRMNAVYSKAIAPAIEDAGYQSIRVDNILHNGKNDDKIIALIRRSRFVVADFTAGKLKEPRGGVYYEAGFAYGLGREVIYTCRKDFVKALHFDTRQYNHIVWEKDKYSDFRKALQNRIEATIGRGPKTKDDAE